MKSIETSGKTVEDAVKVGLKELNCDISDVNIDVLEQGSPGLFGMFGKLAKVRISLKEEEEGFGIDMPIMSLDSTPEKKPKQPKPAAPKQTEPKKPAAPAPAIAQEAAPVLKPSFAESKSASDKPAQDKPQRAPKPPRAPKPIDPTPIPVSMEDLPELDESKLTDVGKIALDFLSNVTRMMGVDVEIRIVESEGQMQVQMIGDSLGVLIGRRGDTLDALQYLTSLQVNKGRNDYVRVTLDTEHYRAKRVDALTKLANRMASRVRKTGHRMALEPMNPYERRILHSALQGHPYVTTHSEGDEPYRRVIITLK